ncbi:class I SAM-dependent methyltransferase [Halobaculum limi]|uniref:class I SAM-dependent methyltransferase n=1 Tax=Halobaculum limi TaxID=3031916 RepID=UPI002407439A|nr:class I SAM-dependent methyltransferase [Halobaculum sp. YSMS11]
MEGPDPRIADHYDDLAEYWGHIADSPSKAQLLWPSIEAMLPDLTNRRVLDAGCGSGDCSAKLLERGADVIGVDVSEEMVAVAKEHVPAATFVQGDLADGLDFIADDSLDVIVCQHVFSHLEELTTPLAEFARILVDGGVLVVSTHNPLHDYLVVRDGVYPTVDDESDTESRVETGPSPPNYPETERYDIIWNPEGDATRATYYRRSIEGLFSPLTDAGFTVQEMTEPSPDDGFERNHPEIAEALRSAPPTSICLRATR